MMKAKRKITSVIGMTLALPEIAKYADTLTDNVQVITYADIYRMCK